MDREECLARRRQLARDRRAAQTAAELEREDSLMQRRERDWVQRAVQRETLLDQLREGYAPPPPSHLDSSGYNRWLGDLEIRRDVPLNLLRPHSRGLDNRSVATGHL